MTLLQTVTPADRVVSTALDDDLDALQIVEQLPAGGQEVTFAFTSGALFIDETHDGSTKVYSPFIVPCSNTAKDKELILQVTGAATSVCWLYMEAALNPASGYAPTWFVVDDGTGVCAPKYILGATGAAQAIGNASYYITVPVSVVADLLRLVLIANTATVTVYVADIKMRTVT